MPCPLPDNDRRQTADPALVHTDCNGDLMDSPEHLIAVLLLSERVKVDRCGRISVQLFLIWWGLRVSRISRRSNRGMAPDGSNWNSNNKQLDQVGMTTGPVRLD